MASPRSLRQAIRRLLPRRPATLWRHHSLKEHAAAHGHWHRVKAPEAAPSARGRFIGFQGDQLEARRTPQLPELGVAALHRPTVWGRDGWVFTAQGSLLSDASWYGAHLEEMDLPRRLPKPRLLKGTCISFCSDWSYGNYGHFLLDLLPRLHLLEEAGLRWQDVDHVLLPQPRIEGARHLLDRLEIPPSKIVWATQETAFTADTMLVTSFPGARRTYPHWLPAFLKQRFGGDTLPEPGPTGRLYLSRAGYSRAPSNEDDVRALVSGYGFVVIEPHRGLPLSMLKTASVIVGAHGAGLAHTVFAPQGATLIELVPSDHQFPYFYSSALAAHQHYVAILCGSSQSREELARGPSPFDFHVDLDLLAEQLQAL
jgi:hypothetical protein